MTSKIAVISTSINSRPRAYAKWATFGTLIVAGDTNTEPGLGDYVEELEGVYLAPYQQTEWRCSDVLGWRTVQRRNVAILEAIRRGFDIIVTVDDDNTPTTSFLPRVINSLRDSHSVTITASESGWYDPCSYLEPPVHHRGYPYSQRNFSGLLSHHTHCTVLPSTIAVVASLWTGDPDVDAMERLVNRPVVRQSIGMVENVVLRSGTWCPFNSQATAWQARFASLMMCWPGVGRFDDIWASYLARRVLDQLNVWVEYAAPSVVQDRNRHDLLQDLQNELLGYRYTDLLCTHLRTDIFPDGGDVHELRRAACKSLSSLPFLPAQTTMMFEAWDEDVATAEKERASL